MAFEQFNSTYPVALEGEVIRAYEIEQKRDYSHPLLSKEKRKNKLESLAGTCEKITRLIKELPADLHSLFASDEVFADGTRVTEIKHLRLFASEVAARAREEIPLLPPKKQTLDYQKRGFLVRLCILYEWSTGCIPSITTDAYQNRLTGRFADFLDEVAELDEIHETANALKRRARDVIPVYKRRIRKKIFSDTS